MMGLLMTPVTIWPPLPTTTPSEESSWIRPPRSGAASTTRTFSVPRFLSLLPFPNGGSAHRVAKVGELAGGGEAGDARAHDHHRQLLLRVPGQAGARGRQHEAHVHDASISTRALRGVKREESQATFDSEEFDDFGEVADHVDAHQAAADDGLRALVHRQPLLKGPWLVLYQMPRMSVYRGIHVPQSDDEVPQAEVHPQLSQIESQAHHPNLISKGGRGLRRVFGEVCDLVVLHDVRAEAEGLSRLRGHIEGLQ